MVKTINPNPAKAQRFAEAYCKSADPIRAALAAGYSELTSKQHWRAILESKRVQDLLRGKPVETPVPELPPTAVYDRAIAVAELHAAYLGALEDRQWVDAAEIVEQKIMLFGLREAASDKPQTNIQNNLIGLATDDQLYTLLTRIREEGNAVDTESIGHEVFALAKQKPKDHRQAEPVGSADA